MNHLLALILIIGTITLLGVDFASNARPTGTQQPVLAGTPTDYPVIGRVCSRS